MSEVVGGARARRRVPGAALVAGVATICLVLSAVPAAARPASSSLPMPGGTAVSRPVHTVEAAPAAPALTADTVTGQTRGAVGRPGDPVTVTLTATGAEGSQRTYSAADPASGVVRVVGDKLTYTPADGVAGEQVFRYTVAAGGVTADGTVKITVSANRIPSTPDEEASTRGATSRPGDLVTIPLVVSDPEGDGLTWSVQDPVHGSAAIEAPGPANPSGPTITYVPDRTFAATEEFTYRATDTYGGVGTGIITVAVTPNSPPTAPTLTASTRSSTSRTGLPVRADLASTDADGDPISYALGAVTGGTATLERSGELERVAFTPAVGYVGTASVAYTAGDGYGPATAGTIAVTVSANAAPVASGVSATVKGSTTRTGDVAVLDLTAVDPDDPGEAADAPCDDAAGLCYELLDQPTAAQGTAQLVGAQLNFIPAKAYSGTVALRYRVTDAVGDAASASASVVVRPNESPTTPAVSGTTQGSTSFPGTALTVVLPASDPDGIASYAAASTTRGTVVVNGSSLTYTPKTGTSGTDTFSYTAMDARGAANSGTVTVNVLKNTAPVPDEIAAQTRAGDAINIQLTAQDAQGDALVFTPDSPPSSSAGSVRYAESVVTFTPVSAFSGVVSFTYRVRDVRSTTGSTGTVTVSVIANRPPVATMLTGQTRGSTAVVTGAPVALAFTAADPDGDALTYSALSALNGTVALIQLASGPGLRYTPVAGFHGTDVVSYLATDSRGAATRGEVRITVTANAAPTAPTVQVHTRGSTAGTGDPVSIPLIPTDPDQDAVSLSISAPATGVGTVSTLVGNRFVFTPAMGFTGPAVVPYTATDTLGATTSGVVVIDVRANRLPTASPTAASTRGGSTVAGRPVLIALGAGISDPDGDALTVSGTAGNGTVAVSGTTVSYVPRAGFAGTDTILYRVADGRGGSAQSTVTVAVAANRLPTLASGTRQMPAGSQVVLGLNGVDPDGDTLTYSLAGVPTRGTATLSGRLLTYSSPQYFAGAVTVRTRVTDAYGATAVSSMTYTVRGVSSVTRIATVGRAVSTTPPTFAISVKATTGSVNGGLVTITSSGRVIGTGRAAANGTVTITSRVNFSKGTHPLTVSFGGTPTTGSAAAGSRVAVS